MKKFVVVLVVLFAVCVFAQIKNPENRRKFSERLLYELDRVEETRNHDVYSSAEIAQLIDKKLIPVDVYLRIQLRVILQNESVVRKLVEYGCELQQLPEGGSNIWLPYDKLDQIASLNGISQILPAYIKIELPPHGGPHPVPCPPDCPKPQPVKPQPVPEKEKPRPAKPLPVLRPGGSR